MSGYKQRLLRRDPMKTLALALLSVAIAFAATITVVTVSIAFPVQKGLPFTEPLELVSQNGVLRVTLTADEKTTEVSGTKVKGRVYNGLFVGPTLRVRPGDRLEITLVNRLRQYTNLHFHGMHVSPVGNSDNIFVMVEPGKTFHYVVKIPTDHPTGAFWYHSHGHPHSEDQVFGGLSGTLIVDGIKDKLPPALRTIRDRVFDLKDLQVRNGAIVASNINSDAPTTRTTNGLVNPRLAIQSGGTQLWRFANIGADIFYRLHLQGHRFHVIAEDGNPVDKVWTADELILPPGKRFEVLVQGGRVGTYELRTLFYNQGTQGDQYPPRRLATLTVRGPAQPAVALPTRLVPFKDLRSVPIAKRRELVFSENDATNQFFINGKQFNMDQVDQRVELGTTEEWVIRNVSQEQHPFHIHVNDFQVISVNGKPYDAHGLQDTVILPAQGKVVIRMSFQDFIGKFVYHCHILAHEDNGMMGVVEVVKVD